MSIGDTVILSLIAALLSLDQVACLQMLLSRPIPTAFILGCIFGHWTDAILVGICFEFLFSRSIPMKERASADPTLATAAVLGGIWGSSVDASPMMAVPFAAVLGLLPAFLSKWLEIRLRSFNTFLFNRIPDSGRVQAAAVGLLFAKSFALYLVTVFAMQAAVPKMIDALGVAAPLASSLAWLAFACIWIAYASIPFIHGASGRLWAVSLTVGTAIVIFSRLIGVSPAVSVLLVLSALAVFGSVETVRYVKTGLQKVV